MPGELQAGERLIHETTSLCAVCKASVPAHVVARSNREVWMLKRCDTHGEQQARLSTDADWYVQTRAIEPVRAPPAAVAKPLEHGCPFDCGPCELHTQKIRLPIVTITSACNLDCPICYVHNKNDGAFHMDVAEFERVLEHLTREHGEDFDVLNLTGGEPTMHPNLVEFLAVARDAGIHRVSICSNGIRMASDESLVKSLAEVHARVALSFDTFEPGADRALQGAELLEVKRRCLDHLEKHGVDTTLIPVMTRGVNDHEIGAILSMAFARPNVRHVEVHTMTFTGQSGATFDRSGRISTFEVLQRIEETTHGLLLMDDFVPSPCAHPLCYQIAYLLVDPQGGAPIPFARFMPKTTMYAALADRLYLEPSPVLEQAIRDAIDRLWIHGGDDSARTLRLLKNMLEEMFPMGRTLSRPEALRVAERAVKAVYIHSHMDEETFDTERVAECCDSNCYADGRSIPVCSYNVIYREKEPRFNARPKSWNARSGGRRSFGVSLPIVGG